MKDFVAEFKEEQYITLVRDLMTDTVNDLIEKEDTISQTCIADIERAISNVVQLQKQGLPSVTNLVISLMYTSVYFEKPQLRLDFYHEPWIVGEAFYSEYIDAKWLFTHWEAHKGAMAETGKNLRAWIHDTHLESMCWQSVRILAYVLSTRLKYWIQNLKKSGELKKMQVEDEFYISFGEYMDWQKSIFAVLPEIDIFNCSPDDSLRFREYKKCRYNQKKFAELDLSMSLFRNCTFENCMFDGVNLSDAVFENCQISNTVFSKVKMSGALFLDTQLKMVTFKETIAEPASRDYKNEDLYRNMDFNSCMIENIKLQNCRFSGAFLTDCLIQGVKINGGDYKYSDFSKFLGGTKAKQEDA